MGTNLKKLEILIIRLFDNVYTTEIIKLINPFIKTFSKIDTDLTSEMLGELAFKISQLL